MTTLGRLVASLVLIFAGSAVLTALAFGEPAAVPAAAAPSPAGVSTLDLTPLSNLSLLIVLACSAASWAARAYSKKSHFFHTQGGAMLLAIGSGVAAALPPVISAHGLSRNALVGAIFGVALSRLSSAKAAGKEEPGILVHKVEHP